MTPLIVNHTSGCQYRFKGHTDDAMRVADAITLHWVAGGWDGCVGRWMAFKLADGRTDNILYPSQYDAVRHQKGIYQHYMYLKLVPGGMSICEAEILLALHRKARQRDIGTPDIDQKKNRDLIPRLTVEERNQQLRQLGG
jgi:hypothetical protein